MFAWSLDDLERKGRVKVDGQTGITSARYLTKQDGLWFSLTRATLGAGHSQVLEFGSHWEINLVLEGRGQLEDTASGETHGLEPGTLWLAGPGFPHCITAESDLAVLGLFNPALDKGTRPGLPRMELRTPKILEAMGRAVTSSSGKAELLRYLLTQDGMGLTISDCRLKLPSVNPMWYRNHWEANLILSGKGSVEDLATGDIIDLKPGTLYCVGPDDRHIVRNETPVHLLSIFNPPLDGTERHDDQGGYPPTGPIPPGPGR